METACHSSSERRERHSVELKFVIAIGAELVHERPIAFGCGVVIDYVYLQHDILNMANSGKPSALNKLGFMLIV